MAMRKFLIIVKGDEVICKPEKVHIKHDDTVYWTSKQIKTFTIFFGVKTPLGEKEVYGKKGTTKQFDILANATATGYPLEFKYTVAVYDEGRIKICDPTIIIDP